MLGNLAFESSASPDLVPLNAEVLPANQAHLRYRADIDGLRAIAVLAVVFYHSALRVTGGFVGVDVFFVISGYLITKIIYNLVIDGKFSFLDFYNRRIRRLFPALFVMLLSVAAWAELHMIWTDVRHFAASLFAATAYVSNVYFYLGGGYFDAAARTQPLLHTWSLGIEEQFYIAVPFVIFAVARWLPRRAHLPMIVALSLLSFGACIWLTNVNTSAAFYLLPPRAWELGMGGALAISAPPVHRYRWLAETLSFAGLAAILFACMAFSDGTPFPGWRVAIPTVGTAAILSTGGQSRAFVERLLGTPPLRFIGNISYSLYLWHWPVIVAFTYAAVQPITLAQSVSAVLISFILAVLSWWFVERPFRRRQLLPSAWSLFAAAAGASLSTIALAGILHHESGFQDRYPRNLVVLWKDVRPISLAPQCFDTKPAKVIADRLCVRGAANVRPTFILIGDSHAGALSDGLFAAARSRGLAGVQFTAAGIMPLPDVLSTATDAPLRQPLTRDLLLYLRQHPELRTVIVTAYWSYRATGESFRHPMVLNYDAQYDGSGVAYNPIAFRHGLERLVDDFPNRRFVFLDDTPSGDALSGLDYIRALYNGMHSQFGLARKLADRERATYEPILEKLAAHHRNVSYFPVLGRVCGPELCPLFVNGHPLYRDGDHLTVFGSMQFAPALGAVFDQLSQQRQPPFKGPLDAR